MLDPFHFRFLSTTDMSLSLPTESKILQTSQILIFEENSPFSISECTDPLLLVFVQLVLNRTLLGGGANMLLSFGMLSFSAVSVILCNFCHFILFTCIYSTFNCFLKL